MFFLPFSLDLDAWINDPPSEDEDESVRTNTQFDTNNNNDNSSQNLFQGESYYHGSNLDSYGGSDYQKSTNYVEPSTEELEKKRETRKQSEKLNPFYLKDSPKAKLTENVCFKPLSNRSNLISCKF